MKSKLYSLELSVDQLLAELENYFRMQGHQVQLVAVAGGQILQALKESTLSVITGQSSALTIKVMPQPQGTLVEIGASKWIDKAAAGVIGYVLLPPLILFPIIGMYNQYRLSEEAWRIIDSFASRTQAARTPPNQGYNQGYNSNYNQGYNPNYNSGYSQGYNPNQPPSNQGYTPGSWSGMPNPNHTQPSNYNPSQNCLNCGAWLASGAAFCSGCGVQTATVSAPICKKCGTTNLRGARFCSSCGEKFE